MTAELRGHALIERWIAPSIANGIVLLLVQELGHRT